MSELAQVLAGGIGAEDTAGERPQKCQRCTVGAELEGVPLSRVPTDSSVRVSPFLPNASGRRVGHARRCIDSKSQHSAASICGARLGNVGAQKLRDVSQLGSSRGQWLVPVPSVLKELAHSGFDAHALGDGKTLGRTGEKMVSPSSSSVSRGTSVSGSSASLAVRFRNASSGCGAGCSRKRTNRMAPSCASSSTPGIPAWTTS